MGPGVLDNSASVGVLTSLPTIFQKLGISFESDIVTVDYRVRGFTRDVDGKKHYTDHDMSSIQDYLTDDTRAAYQMMDVNVYQDNLFHTKMILREFNLDNYVFGVNASDLDPREADDIHQRLQKEMLEIFYSRNLP